MAVNPVLREDRCLGKTSSLPSFHSLAARGVLGAAHAADGGDQAPERLGPSTAIQCGTIHRGGLRAGHPTQSIASPATGKKVPGKSGWREKMSQGGRGWRLQGRRPGQRSALVKRQSLPRRSLPPRAGVSHPSHICFVNDYFSCLRSYALYTPLPALVCSKPRGQRRLSEAKPSLRAPNGQALQRGEWGAAPRGVPGLSLKQPRAWLFPAATVVLTGSCFHHADTRRPLPPPRRI